MRDIHDVLAQALGLHQTGHLQEAAALYRRALTIDSNCADALHLLGMIALQQGEPESAAQLIQQAIAINNREPSYHFHHALALQSLNDMAGAVAGYRRALALKPDDADAYNNLGNALAALNRPEEAVVAFRRALALNPANAVAHNNLGHVQRGMRRWHEAEASFRKAIALQPAYAGAFVNLGNLAQDRSDWSGAESCYRHALALAPRDTAALCGLGVTQWQLGRQDEALASYRAALAIDPAHSETLINLGIAREQSGALEEAESLYARALTASPNDPDTFNHLASARLARGDGAGAMAAIRATLDVRETPRAKKLFVECARRFDFDCDDAIARLMARALSEPWDRPGALSHAAARVIRADPEIGPMVARAAAAWPAPLSLAELLGDAGFAVLARHPLLVALLTSAPNTDIALECFLTLLRRAMLTEPPVDDDAAECFASVLAQQCFLNDYVFAIAPDETRLAQAAARAIEEAPHQAAPIHIMLTAAYLPLHTLVNAESLSAQRWPDAVQTVVDQQIVAPFEEQALRAALPRLTDIENPVSRAVQNQYEESPYPRWYLAAPETPDRIDTFLAAKFPQRFERPPAPLQDILIAGCGTGQRAIAMAQKFGAAHMLAIDLSLASLGYAQRKSQALNLPIAYAQADILALGKTDRRFDLIESLGVLHHLADPWQGWRALLSVLRPGGVMLLGLYSESARRPIEAARARIAERGVQDIRAFRQELMGDPATPASILESEDFFSLSACRDLLFHVQEQQVTLPQIVAFIQDHKLTLLGFELIDAVIAAYRQRFPQDRPATDLANWAAFETEHPGLFAGMYIFWVQKLV